MAHGGFFEPWRNDTFIHLRELNGPRDFKGNYHLRVQMTITFTHLSFSEQDVPFFIKWFHTVRNENEVNPNAGEQPPVNGSDIPAAPVGSVGDKVHPEVHTSNTDTVA